MRKVEDLSFREKIDFLVAGLLINLDKDTRD
jgi:hypothetical protein